MKNWKLRMVLFIFIGAGMFFLSFLYTQAHSPYVVHYPLGENAVDLYNIFFPDKVLTNEQRQWIAEGSAEEDTPSMRVVHHFYDPVKDEGLQGFESSKEWAHDSGMQALNRFQVGGERGIYTWEEAILAYNRGDYRQAYKTLGHIFHLIQDASVPAHTRQDPHLHIQGGPFDFELYGGGDPLEEQAKLRSLKVSNLQGLELINYNSLDAYFDAMANYSNKYFLSKDSLGYYDLPKITRIDTQYIYGTDIDGTEIMLAKIFTKVPTKFFDQNIILNSDSFSDPLVINDYWNRLAPKSVEYSAGIIKLFHDTVENTAGKQNPIQKNISWWGKTTNFLGNVSTGITSRVRSTLEVSKFAWNRYAPDITTFTLKPKISAKVIPSPPFVIPAVNLNPSISTYQAEADKKAQEIFVQQLQIPAQKLQEQFQIFIDAEQEQAEQLNNNTNQVDEIFQEEAEQEQFAQLQNDKKELHTVTRVIDGDTIELENGEKVRYVGINAPELPEGCFSKEAKQQNAQLVLNKQVFLEPGPQDRDVYDRLLRYVWQDNNLINKNLIETGHVYAFDFGFTHKFTNVFELIEQKAKEDKIGLWGEVCHPQEEEQLNTETKKSVTTEDSEYNQQENNNEGNQTQAPQSNGGTTRPPSILNNSLLINEVALDEGEFIEIYNNSSKITYLDNYYINYYSKSRTSWDDPYRSKQFLTGLEIKAFQYFVIAFGDYGRAYDWKPYTSNQLSNSSGAVSLFFGNPKESGEILDAFGWGEANLFEGNIFSEKIEAGTSVTRNYIHIDTDSNLNDFTLTNIPTPGASLPAGAGGSSSGSEDEGDNDENSGEENDNDDEEEENEDGEDDDDEEDDEEDSDDDDEEEDDDDEDDEEEDDDDEDDEEEDDDEEDTEAPSAITNLIAQSGDERRSIKLTWDAVEDNEAVENYIIKYLNETVTQDNWDSATEYEQDITPEEGEEESLVIDNLLLGNLYYFGIRAEDEAGNESILSNIVSVYPNAAPDKLVINEIQVDDDEFVELYNPTDSAIDFSGYYFSYYSSNRTSWYDPYRNKQFPSGATISAGGYYLIGLKGYTTANDNPNADWQPYTSAQLSNSKGTLAIFSEDPNDNDGVEPVDAIAWGDDEDVALKETKTTTAPIEDKSASRNTQHLDSDNNYIDFTQQAPSPTNSSNEIISGSFSANPIWASFQNSFTNTGLSSYSAPTSTPSVLWDEELDGLARLTQQPVVDSDGNIYFSTEEKTYSYTSTGEERWEYDGNGYLALSDDSQKLYLVSDEFQVLNSVDGSEINTSVLLGGWVGYSSHPVIDGSGDVYIANPSKIYSFDSDGDLNWKKDWLIIKWDEIFDNGFTNNSVRGVYDPVLYDGKLYIVAKPDIKPVSWYLLEINTQTGNLNLQKKMETLGITHIVGNPSINSDGLLFIPYERFSNKFGVAAFDITDNGERKWTEQFAWARILKPPAIDNEGDIYTFEHGKSTVYKLEIEAGVVDESKYFFIAESDITTSLIIDNSNNVIFGTEDGVLYSVFPNSTNADPQLNWQYQLGGKVVHITSGDGVIYAITDEVKIYALE